MNTLSIYNYASTTRRLPVYNRRMDKAPNNIRTLRLARNLSQETLGKAIGRKKDTISKWERGERGLKMAEAEKLARVLGVSVSDLAIANEDSPVLYHVDEELMSRSCKALISAFKDMNKPINPETLGYLTSKLYNEIVALRRTEENAEPTQYIAAIMIGRHS